MYLACDHRSTEVRRIVVDGTDDPIGGLLARLVPAATVRKLRRELLTEQARHMRPRRRKAVINRRRNENFYNRLPRHSKLLRIAERAVHVVQRGRDNDATLMMLARLRK